MIWNFDQFLDEARKMHIFKNKKNSQIDYHMNSDDFSQWFFFMKERFGTKRPHSLWI